MGFWGSVGSAISSACSSIGSAIGSACSSIMGGISSVISNAGSLFSALAVVIPQLRGEKRGYPNLTITKEIMDVYYDMFMNKAE